MLLKFIILLTLFSYILGVGNAFDDKLIFNPDLVEKCKIWFKVKYYSKKILKFGVVYIFFPFGIFLLPEVSSILNLQIHFFIFLFNFYNLEGMTNTSRLLFSYINTFMNLFEIYNILKDISSYPCFKL